MNKLPRDCHSIYFHLINMFIKNAFHFDRIFPGPFLYLLLSSVHLQIIFL